MQSPMKEREWTCTVADTPLAALPSRPPFQHFCETGRLAAPGGVPLVLQSTKERSPVYGDSQASEAMNKAEGGRRGAVAQHDERRRKTMRATRFRRAALFAERPVGTGKKVKGREIDVAPWFCAGTCASKAANHWQATAPRRAPEALSGPDSNTPLQATCLALRR